MRKLILLIVIGLICFSTPSYAGQATKPAFKGMELYSYAEDGKNIKYALLLGTNGNKHYKEIVEASIDYNVLINKIKELVPGGTIFWTNSSVQGTNDKNIEFKYPDKDIVDKIESICKEYNITLHILKNIVVELDNKSNVDLGHLCNNANSNNSYECFQIIEKSQLAKHSSITRRGDQLVFPLKNGHNYILKNINPGESDGKSYTFRTYLKSIGYYLFEISYYEGHDFLLINGSSGKKFVIDNFPVISPDGKRFITASVDLEAHYNSNRIQIYKLTLVDPSLEWSFEPKEAWGAANPKWINNEKIQLDKATSDENGYQYSPMTLLYRNGTWVLKD